LNAAEHSAKSYIECFNLQHSSSSPDDKNVDKQSLCNESQHVDNNPNNSEEVQTSGNKSDHQLEQVHVSSDESEESILYLYLSTGEKSSTSCNRKKSYDAGKTEEAQHQSACNCNQCLGSTNWSYTLTVTDLLSGEEICYQVCRHNLLPARDLQQSAAGKVVSGPRGDAVYFENLDLQVRQIQKP
jgi:hypothetical protein